MAQKPTTAVVDEELRPGETTLRVVFRGSLAECEAWVAEREKIEPEKVHSGGYGIDTTEFGDGE